MKPGLRNAALMALVLALSSLLLLSQPAPSAADTNLYVYPKPQHMANLVLRAPSGQIVSLDQYRGKVVLLHFWSINCPACKMEEPLLHDLKRNFGPAGLEILGVNLVDTPQDIAGYAAANRMPFPVLFDGGQGFKLQVVNMAGKNTAFLVNPGKEAILEVPGFPTTYILDCRGSAVGYSVGATQWTGGSALKLINNLVGEVKTCRPRVSLEPTLGSTRW
jgi:thiol-disulfide isomerase/thioredoxin